MRVLIAEDNPRLLKTLTRILKNEGYAVDGVTDGNTALDYVRSCDYDGVVLDIMMPGMSGLDVLKTMRAEGKSCPSMFLTALSDVSKRVEGLEAGADDYLGKPFEMAEFVARMHALLRRRARYSAPTKTFADVSLSAATHNLEYQGASVQLNGKEYQVLELLMGQPGAFISIDTLLARAWNWESKADSSVVWVQISNIRKRFAAIDAPLSIRFERGAGYVLEATDADGERANGATKATAAESDASKVAEAKN